MPEVEKRYGVVIESADVRDRMNTVLNILHRLGQEIDVKFVRVSKSDPYVGQVDFWIDFCENGTEETNKLLDDLKEIEWFGVVYVNLGEVKTA